MTAAARQAQDYGSSDWGISTSTIQDMIQSDMISRSLQRLQDVTGLSDHSSRRHKRSKSLATALTAEQNQALDLTWLFDSSGEAFTQDPGVEKVVRAFPDDQQAGAPGADGRGDHPAGRLGAGDV